MEDIPKQIMALAKKVAKTTFSFQGMRSDGLDKKQAAIPTKRRHPIEIRKTFKIEYTKQQRIILQLFV